MLKVAAVLEEVITAPTSVSAGYGYVQHVSSERRRKRYIGYRTCLIPDSRSLYNATAFAPRDTMSLKSKQPARSLKRSVNQQRNDSVADTLI